MLGLKHFFQPCPIDTKMLGIHGIGIHEHMPPHIVNRVHGTRDYLLMHFYQSCYIRDKAGYRIHPSNSFIIWTPDWGHCYGNPNNKWVHSWLHCSGALITRWLRETRLPTNKVFSLPEPVVFERSLERLHAEATGSFKPDGKILRNLMENATGEIARVLRNDRIAQIPQWLHEIRAYLDAHFTEPIHLAMLSRKVHRSEAYLCQCFKKYFCTSVIDYVIGLRMRHASYLLRDHNFQISDIARRVGYEDVYHFSKLFKKRYGRSPLHARKDIFQTKKNT